MKNKIITKLEICKFLLTTGNGQMGDVVDRLYLFLSQDKLPSPILIIGETGTGKEYIAHLLLNRNVNKDKGKHTSLNCAALSKDLLESELFGHEKGAFTGSTKKRVGILKTAETNGLFLDEFDKAPPEFQDKILRYLREGEIRPLGADKPEKPDKHSKRTPIIFATSVPLEKIYSPLAFHIKKIQTESKRIKSRKIINKERQEDDKNNSLLSLDFISRIAHFLIIVPPVRDRIEDLGILLDYFFNENQSHKVEKINGSAIDYIISHSWPMNITELQIFVKNAMIFADNGHITLNGALRYWGSVSFYVKRIMQQPLASDSFTYQYLGIAGIFPDNWPKDEPCPIEDIRTSSTNNYAISSIVKVMENVLFWLKYDNRAYQKNKFNNCDNLDIEKIKKYFELFYNHKLSKNPKTITDLWKKLGFNNRQSFTNWRKKNHLCISWRD